MNNGLLQNLLNEGLLRDVGDDQVKFQALNGAAEDLARGMQEAGGHANVIPFTLAALDPEVPDDEPALVAVEEALIPRWGTYRNAFPTGRPRQLLRAALLEAVRVAGAADVRVGAAAWYTGVSVLPHMELGSSRPIVEGLLLSLGRSAEGEAVKAWDRPTPAEPFKMPATTKAQTGAAAQASTITPPTIVGKNLTSFTEALTADIAQLQVVSSGYASNSAASWPQAFGPKLAEAVAKTVNEGLKALATELSSKELLTKEGMKEYANEIGVRVRAAVGEAQRASEAQGLRNELLWWRQTLYSPLMKRGYRELAPADAALAMALDLHTLVPLFAPQSVEYLLREAVREVLPGGDELTRLTPQAFGAAAARSDVPWLGEYASPDSSPRGPSRVPLLRYAELAALGRATAEPERWLGAVAGAEMPVADLAVWAYRDFQAAYLVAAK